MNWSSLPDDCNDAFRMCCLENTAKARIEWVTGLTYNKHGILFYWILLYSSSTPTHNARKRASKHLRLDFSVRIRWPAFRTQSPKRRIGFWEYRYTYLLILSIFITQYFIFPVLQTMRPLDQRSWQESADAARTNRISREHTCSTNDWQGFAKGRELGLDIW